MGGMIHVHVGGRCTLLARAYETLPLEAAGANELVSFA